MHFWIDKRSQCGYSGRRMPTSLSAGVGRASRERHLKRMVTPVHRFQNIECVAGSARRPPGISSAPRVQHQPPNTSSYNNVVINNGVLYPQSLRGALQADSSVYLEVPRAEASRSVEIAPIVAPSPPPLMTFHLKCGLWATFAVTIMFVAGSKIYYDHQTIYEQGTGMEAIIIFALLTVFLLGICTISLCRARTVPPLPLISIPPPTPPTQSQDSNEDLALGTILSLQVSHPPGPPSPEPPPPPYHIAVLLPQRTIIQSEVPPPTYEKAIS